MDHRKLQPAIALATVLSLPAAAGAATLLPDFAAATFAPGAAIDNPYLSYRPGDRSAQVARGIDDEGEDYVERDEQVVRPDGPEISGVHTTTVVDKAFEDGKLVERTRDYYAQDSAGNVWYFGEDVENFDYDDEGKLIGTDSAGSWRAGQNGAAPGWAMPADQIVGRNYYQEFAPADAAVDEAMTYALLPSLTVGGMLYSDVLQVLETTVVEPDAREFKYYARGVGLIRAEEGLDMALLNPETVFNRTEVSQVPLPPGLALLGAGVAALLGFGRRRSAGVRA